jgi:citrate synthase
VIERVLARAHPVTRLSLLVPWLRIAERARSQGDAAAERARARGLIARMACLRDDREHPSIASAVAAALGARASEVQAVNKTLVVIADHELNVSSFAARVAASAGADLHACIAAALAAISGTLHGGECDRVEVLARVARTPDRAARAVRERAKQARSVPGFGHPLYPGGDPRTAPLLEVARAIAPRRVAVIDAIIAAAKDALGLAPSVDVALVAIARALEMAPGGGAGLFALGRTAGWVAQVLEQREAGFLLRPRARYVGRAVIEGAPRGSD